MLVLATCRVIDAPRPIELLFQAGLVASFIWLTAVNFRASVAIVLFELALAGVSGHWTMLPGGVAGRVFLEATVTLGAAMMVGAEWRRSGRLDLGRYGKHALTLAILLPGVWGAFGLLRGNELTRIISDANGYLFFAFALPLIVLIRDGHGAWLRRVFFAVCATAAVVTAGIIFSTVIGLTSVDGELRKVLVEDLEVGWAVGHMPNGAFRLYLGSGLYLVVGLALMSWSLLVNPRRLGLWLLWGCAWTGIVASYTRGLWIAAIFAAAVVLALAARSLRRPLTVAAVTGVLFAVAAGAGALTGFSLRDYVLDRSATIVSTSRVEDRDQPSGDVGGVESNAMKIKQARILTRHIGDRPFFGHGFGTVVSEYPNDDSASYDLSYLNVLLKAGVLGLLLYLSFPLRVVGDALRARFWRVPRPPHVARRETAVVVAIVLAVLLAGATNPYVLAAFGLGPIVLAIAWLEPGRVREPGRGDGAG
jgi:O-antigen ligase/polysaccharide polymerase Wzy-like membrane protein